MKNTLVALVLGALSLSTVMSSSGPAQAQHRDREPRGSYRRTCTDIRTVRGTLYATCKDRRGNDRETRMLDYRRCPGDIMNDNGRLRCGRR
ncbi:hypothetical protein [Sorangium sp. So ce233]|uniref:hypothetical protein n=1 Tax=Sorangium sp. So ce233 TaxID=3133290 RepID=UPI003F60C81E